MKLPRCHLTSRPTTLSPCPHHDNSTDTSFLFQLFFAEFKQHLSWRSKQAREQSAIKAVWSRVSASAVSACSSSTLVAQSQQVYFWRRLQDPFEGQSSTPDGSCTEHNSTWHHRSLEKNFPPPLFLPTPLDDLCFSQWSPLRRPERRSPRVELTRAPHPLR